jgi:DNA (cytosine-5)-methyltransferase 1
MRPRILDLFCCEGGAAVGYERAGFDVVGVDSAPQPRYPFAFIQADVLSLDVRFLRFFDAIHASPPCQFGTELNSAKDRHVNLIPSTRAMLQASGLPYVIENVRRVRAHLVEPVSLFGTMFDCHLITSAGQRFDLSRERLFETNWGLQAPEHRRALHPIANVFGSHLRVRSGPYRTGKGTGRTVDLPGEDRAALARQLMGMPWASMNGISEAVPPAYTEFVGVQLLQRLGEQRRAAA